MIQPARKVNPSRSNLAALNKGLDAIRERVTAELLNNPAFFGSVSLTFQVDKGLIDRFRVTNDQSTKCEALTG